MANPTLNWTVNKERGTISFGRLLPVTGNTYTLVATGAATGEEFTFYVMDESGDVCLAKSEKDAETGVVTIAFNTEALRNQFAKDWHEVCTFHTCCSNGSATIAESDLSVTWNPLWTDVETGSAWSMRGPQGVGIASIEFVSKDGDGNITYQFRLTNGAVAQWLAPRGPQGPATNLGCVYDKLGDKKWHEIIIRTNRFGEKVLDVDPVGSVEQPETEDIVTKKGEQVITGKKTFTQPIKAQGGIEGTWTGDIVGNVTGSIDATGTGKTAKVPTLASTDDATTSAASTGWVAAKLAAWWTTIKATANTWTGAITVALADAVGIIVKNTNFDITASVASRTQWDAFQLMDANGKVLASLSPAKETDGSVQTNLICGDGNGHWSTIAAIVKSDGTTIAALGANPPSSSNSTEIATCKFVNDNTVQGNNIHHSFTAPAQVNITYTFGVAKRTTNSVFLGILDVSVSGDYIASWSSFTMTSEDANNYYFTLVATKTTSVASTWTIDGSFLSKK